ncbi:molybdenum cofactor guanylyltransferase [Stieleria sp. TO1_6]|uniref:molybdenum cofactor guanylyltransferase n=1 Tax=Stieleria tagensis TaxID=2956795 RepID=UPI00209B7919|nr:molybdenum cofactor guanylyltransferase [Stieleria tagensis]MCO8121735.1 molybdenum cofactor guanylyltransferase [Stieleria tagensis]
MGVTISDLTLLGVVLCGGRSLRMGRDKADLIAPDGRSYLDLACQRLAELCPAVCLSAATPRESPHPTLVDPPDSHGPISGILMALEHARLHRFAGCLINPVDTPDLAVHDLQTLIDTHRCHPDNIVCAIAEPDASYLEPLIAIYPIQSAPSLRAAIERGQFGLQRYLRDRDIVPVPLGAAACRNVNSPTDLTPPSINE